MTPVDVDHVVTLIKALPDKQSASDPLPTWLLKRSAVCNVSHDSVALIFTFLIIIIIIECKGGMV